MAIFNISILLTLAVPLLIYFMHTFFTSNQIWLSFIFLVPFIGGLAGTHVFATTYLYFDRDLSIGVPNQRVKLYLIPIGIIALNIIAVTIMPIWLLLWFMVFYVHYALFHFGRQNIGVLTFSLMSTTHCCTECGAALSPSSIPIWGIQYGDLLDVCILVRPDLSFPSVPAVELCSLYHLAWVAVSGIFRISRVFCVAPTPCGKRH